MHVTHWKAGSQWIRGILEDLFGAAAEDPTADATHVFRSPPEAGKVYPCLYLCKHEFECLNRPLGTRHFVVIRDLRDTLVSGYFSVRYSHVLESTAMERHRLALNNMTQEAGMLYLFHSFLSRVAFIQESWLDGNTRCHRLEDFMANPLEELSGLFENHLAIPIELGQIAELVERHRFEKLSGGRHAGEEDLGSHYRKGVQGDWRRHFTPRLKDRFKEAYNDLLVRGGYERDDSW